MNRFSNFNDSLFIICKRLKLKSEIENDSIKYGPIKSKFFLPGFLPIYASIPDSFKEVFEDDYQNMKDNTFWIANGVLDANIQLLAKDLKLVAKSCNDFKFFEENLNYVPKLFKMVYEKTSL